MYTYVYFIVMVIVVYAHLWISTNLIYVMFGML